ncbi:FAD-dependent monooxygenase [Streptomyces sp. NPDC001450]
MRLIDVEIVGRRDRAPLRRWSTARTTLLGDADHPMLPHHGQGANQAVEDGLALAVCLAEAGPGGDGIAAALARYEAVRRPHTTRVQLGSRDGGGRGPGKGVREQAADVSWILAHDVEQSLHDEMSGDNAA